MVRETFQLVHSRTDHGELLVDIKASFVAQNDQSGPFLLEKQPHTGQ